MNTEENYSAEEDTEKLLRIGKLPEPLRLAAMLEKTLQSPLHGKAADCLRRMYAQAAQPAPEQYAALEQALTRLQKRYGELEAMLAAQPATEKSLAVQPAPVQKPVAWVPILTWRWNNEQGYWEGRAIDTPPYTTPPAQPAPMPLTDDLRRAVESLIESYESGDLDDWEVTLVKQYLQEAKLKEKNT
jgi:hypothetical protein